MNKDIAIGIMFFGLFFNFLGTVALLRFSDTFTRVQVAVKCVTFGTFTVLVGAFVFFPLSGPGLKALLCAVVVVLTGPVIAHAIARGAYLYGAPLCGESVIDSYRAEAARIGRKHEKA